MPNVPPQGIYSSKRSSNETPVPGATPVVDAKATLPGETTPRQVLEIWAGNAAGVPKLVWLGGAASGPATASISYVAGTPASAGHVHLTWTPLSPLRSDRYSISRPDGSLAGTVGQLATSFDDPAPRPLNGNYKLTAQLENFSDPTPALAALNLATGPTSFVAAVNAAGTAGHLTWGHPTWGKPHQYEVWRDGALYVTLDGATTVYDDTNPTRGVTHGYQVFAVLSGVHGGGTAVSSVGFTPLDPISVGLTPATNLLQITFAYPGGAIARYEIQDYDGNSPGWFNQDLNNVSGYSAWSTTTNIGYMRVRSIGVNGLPSNWVQVGPMASIVPVPIFGVGPLSVQASGLARFVVTTETFDTFCAEYYWANFPEYGWRSVGFAGTGSSVNPCQPGDPLNNGVVWWDFQRLQNTPVYARARRLRNGVYSDYVQFGPV